MEEKLRVGVISSTHGIRGEVKVFPTTDNPNRFKKMKEVILDKAQKLGKDEYFIADLLGIAVMEESGRKLGKIKDVIETGANDVYVVEMENKKELLIPAIKQCILKVDVEAGQMVVHLLEGLLEE